MVNNALKRAERTTCFASQSYNMKKFLGFILAVLMVVVCISAAGCNNTDASNEEALKMGLGIYSVYGKSTNADGETDGSSTVSTTAAVVLLDKDGKVVKCVFDTVDAKVEFTSDGAVVSATEYKTKGEQGNDYGMVAYGGAAKEWYEQVDVLSKMYEGKTLDEIKAMIVDGYKGTDDIIAAGCTIGIADFVKAIEKAFANAVETDATKNDTLSLGFVTKQEKATDATEEKGGSCEVVASICATAVKDGKVVAIKSDSTVAQFAFNLMGEFTTDTNKELSTKRELGSDYNMAAYGQDLNGDGVVKEWFEQADLFDAACLGLSADEIVALSVDGYGVDSLQSSGCTIGISDMSLAANKAAAK